MSVTPLEYVGSIHIFLGPYRGNPVALYLRRNGERVAISPKVYPFSSVVGEAETPNKAAADFEEKWKAKGLVAADMYDGPSWEGGIKPERPAPPKPAAAPKPAEAGVSPAARPAAPGASSGPTAQKSPAAASTPAAPAGTPSAPKPAPQSPPSGPTAATSQPSPPAAKTAPSAQSNEEPKAEPPESASKT